MLSRPRILWPGLALAALSFAAFDAKAEAEPPHPIVDVPRTAMPSAQSLRDVATGELLSQRETYARQLDDAAAIATEELETQLLDALLVYDDERIRIIDLIPDIIDRYEVGQTLGDDLMNFRRTLSRIVEELRPEVTSLQKYKPYDFRIGFSYAAMMTIMRKEQAVRDRMLEDQGNPETLLGQHSQRLQQTYREVEKARARLELGYRTDSLREQIDRIDTELRRRQS